MNEEGNQSQRKNERTKEAEESDEMLSFPSFCSLRLRTDRSEGLTLSSDLNDFGSFLLGLEQRREEKVYENNVSEGRRGRRRRGEGSVPRAG